MAAPSTSASVPHLDDTNVTNEWDDEDEAMEAAQQSRRDKIHEPLIMIQKMNRSNDDIEDDEDEDQDMLIPSSSNTDAIIPIEAPPQIMKQSSEELSSSSSDDDDDSSSEEEDELLLPHRGATTSTTTTKVHITPRGSPLLTTTTTTASSSTSLRSSPSSRRYTPTILPSLLDVSAGGVLTIQQPASAKSMLADAMANPPPPTQPVLSAASSSASSSGGVLTGHSPSNVITLSLKKEKGGGVKLEHPPSIHEEEEIDYTAAETGEHHADNDEEEEDDPFKIEDLEEAMDEGGGEEVATTKVKIEPTAASLTVPAAISTTTSTAAIKNEPPINNKIKLSIPRAAPSAVAQPTTTTPTAASQSTKIKIKNPKSPAGAAAATTAVSTTKLPSPPPATVPASVESLSATSITRTRPPGTVIPPTTAVTPHGRTVLARYHSYFFARQYASANVTRVSGGEITKEWCRRTGMREIFIASNASELGMQVPPPTATVRDVITALPVDHPLSVIDVATQQENSYWTLQEWLQYYETPIDKRTAVCNVISLEISQTAYAKSSIKAPWFVREFDWMKRFWKEEVQLEERPKYESWKQMMEMNGIDATAVAGQSVAAASSSAVSSPSRPYTQHLPPPAPSSLYCLMSAASSYTDFHVDFGGSSVWYHIVKGEKMFLVVEPTKENLDVYEKWQSAAGGLGSKLGQMFLPDLYDERDKADGRDTVKNPSVRLLHLKQGETLFLPSGWIHSVYTPCDSLVFGGNFLHSYHIGMQLLIYNLELNTHIPEKFKYPAFESLNWLCLREYVYKLRKPLSETHPDDTITLWELNGLSQLIKQLGWWMKQNADARRLYGIDASRPRLGSKHDSDTKNVWLNDTLLTRLEESTGYLDMIWEWSLPFSWLDATRMLKELDALCVYNIYLIEREEWEDMRDNNPSTNGGDPSSSSLDSPAALLTWSHRESLATRCFQLLQTLKDYTYHCVAMVNPLELTWVKKPPSSIKRRTRMTAAESEEVIRKEMMREKNKMRRAERKAAAEAGEMEEGDETTVAAAAPGGAKKDEGILLPATTSGRTRHHSSKYTSGYVDTFSDDEEDEEETKGGESADVIMTAADESKDGGGVSGTAGASTTAAAASSTPSATSAKPSKKRSRHAEFSDDDESAFSDSDADGMDEEDDSEFEDDKKSSSKHLKKKGKTSATTASAASSASKTKSTVSIAAAAPISDLRARAQAAAAASMSQSKKVIPADAPVKQARSGGKAGAAKSASTAQPKQPKPQMTAKQRMMQKMGLSGKLR